eukprot:TRINITY_DN1470_c0_g3_i1.p1 TRINITY_DN1470_c0_g3~~TRINITY_DN1470_c0_g3_i1.p1  ORF type:complete len:142 (+),score=62.22 TRINITY_DN1470_c0_g3_i1:172-597(+)
MFDKKAKERQEKMESLKNLTLQSKINADKEKEKIEIEAKQRRERLLKLKEASIMRLSEQEAVVTALREREEEKKFVLNSGQKNALAAFKLAAGAVASEASSGVRDIKAEAERKRQDAIDRKVEELKKKREDLIRAKKEQHE